MKPLSIGTAALRRSMRNAAPSSWTECLAWCARAGLRAIEVRDEGSSLAITREMLDAHELRVHVFEARASLALDGTALARAAHLGARHFVHADAELEVLRHEIELAAAEGLRSLWKPRAEASPHDAPALEARVSALAAAGAGMLWDTWHAHQLGLDAGRFTRCVEHVRFSDGTRIARAALGAGDVDLRSQFLALRDALFALPCWGIEFEGCEHFAREARKATGFLREIARSL